jgi:hypothetical protein
LERQQKKKRVPFVGHVRRAATMSDLLLLAAAATNNRRGLI